MNQNPKDLHGERAAKGFSNLLLWRMLIMVMSIVLSKTENNGPESELSS